MSKLGVVNANAITAETRREAYEHVLDTLGQRQKDVYNALNEPMTANELALKLWRQLKLHDSERNKVHPRLVELVNLKLVHIVGKRKCSVSGRKCAIYART